MRSARPQLSDEETGRAGSVDCSCSLTSPALGSVMTPPCPWRAQTTRAHVFGERCPRGAAPSRASLEPAGCAVQTLPPPAPSHGPSGPTMAGPETQVHASGLRDAALRPREEDACRPKRRLPLMVHLSRTRSIGPRPPLRSSKDTCSPPQRYVVPRSTGTVTTPRRPVGLCRVRSRTFDANETGPSLVPPVNRRVEARHGGEKR